MIRALELLDVRCGDESAKKRPDRLLVLRIAQRDEARSLTGPKGARCCNSPKSNRVRPRDVFLHVQEPHDVQRCERMVDQTEFIWRKIGWRSSGLRHLK